MTRYRFIDAMGDVVDEDEFPGVAAAMASIDEMPDDVEEIHRVEYLGPDGDWRWAGALPS